MLTYYASDVKCRLTVTSFSLLLRKNLACAAAGYTPYGVRECHQAVLYGQTAAYNYHGQACNQF